MADAFSTLTGNTGSPQFDPLTGSYGGFVNQAAWSAAQNSPAQYGIAAIPAGAGNNIASVGGLGSAIGGLLSTNRTSGLQNSAANMFQNSLFGSGAGQNSGIGYNFGPNGFNTDFGGFNPANTGLQQLASNGSNFANQFLQNGIPQNVTLGALGFGNQVGNLAGGIGQSGQLMSAGLGQLNNPLINQAQGAAGSNIAQAGMDFNSVYQQQLANLQKQLQLPQQLQMNTNNTGQFARGQLGTTGGALQTQAMATGFGQADLAAAQQAWQQALQTQQNATSSAGVLGTLASNQQLTGNQLYGTGANTQLNFGNYGNNQQLQNFQLQQLMATMPADLAGSALSRVINPALQGGNILNSMGLGTGQLGLNYGVAQSNAARGAGLGMAQLGLSPYSSPSSLGNLLSSLGGTTGANGLIGQGANLLQKLFGGTANPSNIMSNGDVFNSGLPIAQNIQSGSGDLMAGFNPNTDINFGDTSTPDLNFGGGLDYSGNVGGGLDLSAFGF